MAGFDLLRQKIGGVGPWGASAGLWLTHDVFTPLFKSALDTRDRDSEQARAIQEQQRRTVMARLERERLMRDVAQNQARLAALDPQLYNEIMAGEQLAPGEVVIGGEPRTDLMEMLAMNMSQGAYNQPSAEEDILAQIASR